MPKSGHTWQKPFTGEPIEAAHVRFWTVGRVNHPDAPLVANELYVAILGSGAPVVDMQISTAGRRVRITACGADPLSVLYSNGPGWALVVGLAHASGLTTDKRGLWAQLGAQR